MRIWIDLSNSPHVRLFEPVIHAFRERGWDVALTARDHAQTLGLARDRWDDVVAVGGPGPAARGAKAKAVLERARELTRFARAARPDVAFSHGSYSQLLAARVTGVPAATMMDYEHQPANHVSFRLAARVIVPEAFPEASLRKQGARAAKIARYKGFKEELYLAGFEADAKVLEELSLDRDQLLAVFRPPPAGALYHRSINERFDDLLEEATHRKDVQVVLLPRSNAQADVYRCVARVCIPDRVIDTCSLMALADVVIGAGGTMNREAALLGTPTYTVFAGKLAAVDAELIRLGLLRDLRPIDAQPTLVRRPVATRRPTAERAASIIAVIAEVVGGLGERQGTNHGHFGSGDRALATSSTSGRAESP
jgi:uncharacterized protein